MKSTTTATTTETGMTCVSTCVSEASFPNTFEVSLHVAHLHEFESGATTALYRCTRSVAESKIFKPLPWEIQKACDLAMDVERSAKHTPHRDARLLLQIHPEKDLALCWSVPASSSYLSEDGIQALCGASAPDLQLPLLLASVGSIEVGSPENARLCIAIVVPPKSASVTAVQRLKLSHSNGVVKEAEAKTDVQGTWLIECEDEGVHSQVLAQLQRAGCIMHDMVERYSIGELVGVGGSSKVFLAEDRETGEEVAVKLVCKKDAAHDLALLKEATILRWAVHDAVLQFHGIYQIEDPATGDGAWAIVTELIGGGELFEEVRRNGPLSEVRALDVMLQLLSALNFLHHRGIVHRDIKTENVCKTGLGDEIKLVDFGLASPEWDAQAMLTRCGTPGYIAPEVLHGQRYGCLVDCFSVGVLMHILLCGYGPFRSKNLEETLKKNMRCRVSLRSLADRSPEATALVSKLLKAKPEQRCSAEKGLQDPWFLNNMASIPHSTRVREELPVNSEEKSQDSSYRNAKKEKRRMFSVQLGYEDMFFKDLKFADPDSIDHLGYCSQKSDDQDECPMSPASSMIPMPPEALYLSPLHIEEPAEGARDQLLPPSADLATRDSQTNQNTERLYGVTSAADVASTQGRRESKESMDIGDGNECAGPRLTASMFTSCEPLWANVQQTLYDKRHCGVLPANSGLKKVLERQARRERQPQEPERKTAHCPRTANMFDSDPGSHSPRNAAERVSVTSAFYHRDLDNIWWSSDGAKDRHWRSSCEGLDDGPRQNCAAQNYGYMDLPPSGYEDRETFQQKHFPPSGYEDRETFQQITKEDFQSKLVPDHRYVSLPGMLHDDAVEDVPAVGKCPQSARQIRLARTSVRFRNSDKDRVSFKFHGVTCTRPESPIEDAAQQSVCDSERNSHFFNLAWPGDEPDGDDESDPTSFFCHRQRSPCKLTPSNFVY